MPTYKVQVKFTKDFGSYDQNESIWTEISHSEQLYPHNMEVILTKAANSLGVSRDSITDGPSTRWFEEV